VSKFLPSLGIYKGAAAGVLDFHLVEHGKPLSSGLIAERDIRVLRFEFDDFPAQLAPLRKGQLRQFLDNLSHAHAPQFKGASAFLQEHIECFQIDSVSSQEVRRVGGLRGWRAWAGAKAFPRRQFKNLGRLSNAACRNL